MCERRASGQIADAKERYIGRLRLAGLCGERRVDYSRSNWDCVTARAASRRRFRR